MAAYTGPGIGPNGSGRPRQHRRDGSRSGPLANQPPRANATDDADASTVRVPSTLHATGLDAMQSFRTLRSEARTSFSIALECRLRTRKPKATSPLRGALHASSQRFIRSLSRLQSKFVDELIVRVASMALDPFDLDGALRGKRLQLPP